MENSVSSNIRKAYFFEFFSGLHFISGVLVPFFVEWGGISFFQITILQSWFVFCAFFLEVPTGVIADYFGRKASISLACIFNILAVIIYILKPLFWIFMIGELFWDIYITLLSGANEALIYDSLKIVNKEKEVKKIFGRKKSFSLLSLTIAGPIGSFIASQFGMKWTMFSMVIPFTVAFFISLSFEEPKIHKITEKKQTYLQTLKEGIKYLHQNSQLKILALDGIVINILCFLLIWLYQLVLKDLKINIIYFGFVHMIITISQIIIMNSFETLERMCKSKIRYLFVSAFIPGASFIFLGINTHVIPSIVAMALIAGFGITRFVLISSYLQKHIFSHNRATVNSTISMFRRLGSAILYPFIGWMAEFSLDSMLVLLGITIILFALFSKTKESDLLD